MAVLLLAGVCSAQQDRGAKALVHVQLGGIVALKDGDAILRLALNNATKTQAITLRRGEELRATLDIEASFHERSLLSLQLVSQDRNLIEVKILMEGGRARVVGADYDSSTIKPVESKELINVKVTTGISILRIYLPITLADERVEAYIGERTIDVRTEKTANSTVVILKSMIDIDETPPFYAKVASGNLTILELYGKLMAENVTEVSVRGLVREVKIEALRGHGLVSVSFSTSTLLPRPFDDRGVLYRGFLMTLRPLVSAEAPRQVKILILDKFAGKVVEEPVLLSVRIPAYNSSFNMSAPRGEISITLPREMALVSATAPGYKPSSLEIQANVTEACMALEPQHPSLLQRIMLAFEAIASWIAVNWPMLLATSIVALIILAVVRAVVSGR
jgi:hypothetical protein